MLDITKRPQIRHHSRTSLLPLLRRTTPPTAAKTPRLAVPLPPAARPLREMEPPVVAAVHGHCAAVFAVGGLLEEDGEVCGDSLTTG